MSESNSFSKLIELLHEFGIRTVSDRVFEGDMGFAVSVPLIDGGTITLDLPHPALISNLDPDEVGVAVVDPLGYPRSVWGLAKRLKFFRQTENLLSSDLASMIRSAFEGINGSLYLDGYRYHVAGVKHEVSSDVVVLITNALDEKVARRQASKSSREAESLKRIGRALSMNQQLHSLAVAAVHEIASVAELAAVLLWVKQPDSNSLQLVASTGANRSGTSALHTLDARGGSSCLAEMVALSRQAYAMPNVSDHLLTIDLEAKFCYLKPGGVSVHPLETGDSLLGVLELIGREGDSQFLDFVELYQIMAEHLSLALNNAILFEKLEKQASHDPLTGIANHRSMQEFLNIRLAEATRTSQSLGVVMIDVDHFRSFNEEEGHEAGDAVLKMVADTLKSVIRPYDLAARYGGEEFTLILPGSTKDQVQVVAERVRKRIESVPFITRTGRMRHVTASLGTAVYPEAAADGATLLRAADKALYQAKRTGRNRAVAFDGKLNDLRADDIDVNSFWSLVPDKLRPGIENQLVALEPHFKLVEISLGLTKNQQHILRAIAILHDAYVKALTSKRGAKGFESHPDLRSILPSLQSVVERFDGTGPKGLVGHKIPLLSRVYSVCRALIEHNGQKLIQEPGRFDPEIVALVEKIEDAA